MLTDRSKEPEISWKNPECLHKPGRLRNNSETGTSNKPIYPLAGQKEFSTIPL
jgi:hypothetical protein